MAYATGSAHYHRLPALRSVFKNLLERLIHKMLRREVWGYWYLTSQRGKLVDPDLVEMRKSWADPNKQENIMYSGHLLLMVSLHALLFDDDKYDQPGALKFHWDPIFWGFGPEKFTYRCSTLQEAMLAEMDRHNWKGVCCEPNSIFIVCNQFSVIAMLYNDIRNGTTVADKVLENYSAARKKDGGFLQDDKFIINWYMVKQDRIVPGGIGLTACLNSHSVHFLFPEQSVGFFTKAFDGRVNVNDEKVAKLIRELAKSEGADPQFWSTKEKAQELAKRIADAPTAPFSQPIYGYVAQWVSEVAGPALNDGLMRHADMFSYGFSRFFSQYGGLRQKGFVDGGCIDPFLIRLGCKPESAEGEWILAVLGVALDGLDGEGKTRSCGKRVAVREAEELVPISSCYGH